MGLHGCPLQGKDETLILAHVYSSSKELFGNGFLALQRDTLCTYCTQNDAARRFTPLSLSVCSFLIHKKSHNQLLHKNQLVLCVNQDLKMGKGKVAAQCCHAAVGCYKRAKKQCPGGLRAWEMTGCAKIALKCPTEDEMALLAAKAMERDIPFYLVEDAGRTQIAAGSRTVLGLWPAPTYVFEDVTSHLKLM